MSGRTANLLSEKRLETKYRRKETESDMREALKGIPFTDEEKRVLDRIMDRVSARVLEANG